MRRVSLQCAFVITVLAPTAAWAQPLTGPEFQVNTYTTRDQRNPSVGVFASGDFVVAWQSSFQDGSAAGVFARRFARGGTPLDPSEFQVNTMTFDNQSGPSIGVTETGDFVVAWNSRNPGAFSTGAFARRFASDGTPLDSFEFQVNIYTTYAVERPSVGVSPSGDFVVAWSGYYGVDGSKRGVFARRFASDGSALDASAFQVNSFTTDNQSYPFVAVAGSGQFVVAWNSYGQDGSGFGVFARRFASDGSALDASDFQVNTYTTGPQKNPSVGVSASGAFVVAWESNGQDGSIDGVFARRFASDGSALDASDFQVNTYTTGHQQSASVGASAYGDFVVAWQGAYLDGSVFGVFARRFASDGGAMDAVEFQVNTFTTSRQQHPWVGVSASGDFALTWESYAQDGDDYGVFARPGCLDLDADSICDADDIIITVPPDAGVVNCATPGLKSTRPRIEWNGGNYDLFRVQISWDPAFPRGARITSGKKLLSRSHWKPGAKAWRKVCNHVGSEVYIRVFGIDRNVAKTDPAKRTFSNEIAPDAVF